MPGGALPTEGMIVWPEEDPDARPASEFFVNERVDLLIREAETFRNDYRNKNVRVVFHALEKPIPFLAEPPTTATTFREPKGYIDTQRYCGIILLSMTLGCLAISILFIARQNRLTR